MGCSRSCFLVARVWGIPENPASLHNPTVTQHLVPVKDDYAPPGFRKDTLSRGAAVKGERKTLMGTPSVLSTFNQSSNSHQEPTIPGFPASLGCSSGRAHRGCRQGVRTLGCSPPICPPPTSALTVTRSFFYLKPQSPSRQEGERSGPPHLPEKHLTPASVLSSGTELLCHPSVWSMSQASASSRSNFISQAKFLTHGNSLIPMLLL